MATMSFEDIARDRDKIIDAFLNECVFAHRNGYELFGNWRDDSKGKDGIEIRLKRKGEKSGQRGAAAHLFFDMPPHGFIWDFHDGGISANWKIAESGLRFTAGDGRAPVVKLTAQQQQERFEARQKEIAARKAAAAEAAETEFQKTRAAALRSYEEDALFIPPYGAIGPGVDYLKSKGVTAAPGVKLSCNKAGIFPPRALVIPFFDVLAGGFVTFQRIIQGAKGYNSGFGERAAAFWIVPSKEEELDAPAAPKGAPLVLLCEGYATGATCAALFGLPVGITGDVGKLVHVAKAILSAPAWGQTRILIAADDDHMKTDDFKKAVGLALEGKKNTGKAAAIECFNLNRGRVFPVPPPWDWKGRDLEAARHNPQAPRSDWNDFAALYPGEAPAAARAAKAAAVEYFGKQ